MGDTHIGINYTFLFIVFAIWVLIYFLKRNMFNLLNVIFYFLYSMVFVLIINNHHGLMYKTILLHYVVIMVHLVIAIAVNVFRKWQY